jgi:hypothetical protein
MKHFLFAAFTLLISTDCFAFYQGTCRGDDDANISYELGDVFGESSIDLFDACALMAQHKYGENAFSEVVDMEYLSGEHYLEALCRGDDDSNISYDLGQVYGYSSLELIDACVLMARTKYGDPSFSEIKDIQSHPGTFYLEALCRGDDDSNISYDLGQVFGYSSQELIEACVLMAQQKYGESAFSEIKNVQQHSGTFYLEALCRGDDDSNISYDLGQVFGHSSRELIEACILMAQQKYGESAFSEIKNIQQHTGSFYLEALCRGDDDANISYDLGAVFGYSSRELIEACILMAQQKYGENAFSEIKDIRQHSGTFYLEALCRGDDDSNISYDLGQVFGRSSRELVEACVQMAKQKYGDPSFSEIKNVQTHSGNFRLEGMCRGDDDANISYDLGTVYGATSRELLETCQLMAVQRYGENAFSEVVDIRAIPE